MIAEAHTWIEGKLAAAVPQLVGPRVSTNLADLDSNWAKVRPCVLLQVGHQTFQRSGSRVARVAEADQTRTMRRRRFYWRMPLTVLLLHVSEE